MSSWSLSSQDENDALSKMMAFNEDVVLKGHLYMYVDDYVNNPFKFLCMVELEECLITETLFSFSNISSCDLAGSERIKKTKAEGERLSEAQHINFSLLELGYV